MRSCRLCPGCQEIGAPVDWTLWDCAGAKGSAGRAWNTVYMGCEGVQAQGFFCLGFFPRGTNSSCYAVTAPWLKEPGIWDSAMGNLWLSWKVKIFWLWEWSEKGGKRGLGPPGPWVTGAACGEGASVPAVKVWGGTIVIVPRLHNEWPQMVTPGNVSLTCTSFTSFTCSGFQVIPYITFYPAQILFWHF